MYEWLEALKPGDEVFVEDSLRRVDRLTATQIIIGGSRFSRSTGRRIGSSGWRSTCLCEPTPERRREARAAQLRQWARYSAPAELLGLTPDQIAQVREVVKTLKG